MKQLQPSTEGGEPQRPAPGRGGVPAAAGLLVSTLGLALLAACSSGGGGGAPAPPTTTTTAASPNPLGLAIVPPPATTSAPTVTIEGTATAAGSTITVRGGAAPATTTAGADGSFAVAVTLGADRLNELFLRETTPGAELLPAIPIEVVQDGEPPLLTIDFPADGAVLSAPTVRLAGRVGDRLSGFLGLALTVDGDDVAVELGLGPDGSFWSEPLPIPAGGATFDLVATDAAGNERATQVQVDSSPPAGFTLVASGGDGQSAPAGAILAAPLEVRLERPNGSPLVGKLVEFEIEAGGGRLAPDGPGGFGGTPDPQRLTVATDGLGLARARWQLGDRAGLGVHRVRATSVDVDGTARFLAAAEATAARQVHAIGGADQVTAAGGVAPRLLTARVTDGTNPVAGVAVRFEVEGEGLVRDPATGEQDPAVDATTDATGAARVQFFLSDAVGVQRVRATVPGAAEAGAPRFAVRARAGDQPATSLTGTIVDATLRPLVGAECQLELADQVLTTTTDGAGSFVFTGLTADGTGRLTFRGDGVTSVLGPLGQDVEPGPISPYPTVERRVFVEPGLSNRLAAPLVLPRITDPVGLLFNGATDAVLGVAGLPGFVLTLAEGSLTLPPSTALGDGTLLGSTVTPTAAAPLSVPAILNAVQVAVDDLPAPLPGGAPALLAWFVAPAGAAVSQPIDLRVPNVGALEPRSIASILSFDGQAGRFERVGTATVTADGRFLDLAPGSSVTRTGWMALAAGGAVGSEVVFDESAAPVQLFDGDWSVQLGSRTVPAGEAGGFVVSDVPLRDTLGPFDAPDGIADRTLRLTAVRSGPGSIEFATTDPLAVAIGQSQEIGPGAVSALPPVLPVSFDLDLGLTGLAAGAQAPLSLVGFLSDGNNGQLSSSSTGTTYRSSDPDVASVDAEGTVTGVGAGAAIVSAFTEGSVLAVEVAVSDMALQTTNLAGVAVGPSGLPVAGALVTAVGGGATAVTDADGAFQLVDVAFEPGSAPGASIQAFTGPSLLTGFETVAQPVAGGATDLGLVELAAPDRVLVFGEPVDGVPQAIAVADALVAAGFSTDYALTLPADLSSYRLVWCAETLGPLTADEEQALIAFAQSGRGLHLSGERSCCEAANDSTERILDALLPTPIQVGELGDQPGPYTVNDQVIGGLAATPNALTELALCAVGGLDPSLAQANVLARALSGTPVAAAFDEVDLVAGVGRVTVVMDTDWEFLAGCVVPTAVAEDGLVNLATFLLGSTAP